MVIKKCQICGKEFDARGSTVTCSSECRKINQRKNQKEFHKKNPEYRKEYRENHRNEKREYDKRYRENHRDEIREYQKEWRENNPEYQKDWRNKNQDKIQKYDYRRFKRKVEDLITDFNGDIGAIKKYCPNRWLVRELEMLINYNVSYFDGMIAKIESTPVCEVTGSDKNLVIHHLKSYNTHPELGAAPNNMVRITDDIHKEFHSIYGYGNNTCEQWNEFIRLYGFRKFF